jgi:hypothetical protein
LKSAEKETPDRIDHHQKEKNINGGRNPVSLYRSYRSFKKAGQVELLFDFLACVLSGDRSRGHNSAVHEFENDATEREQVFPLPLCSLFSPLAA